MDWMDKDLSDHGAVSYGDGLSGPGRDLPDTDLSDHGAISYGDGLSGPGRDLHDADLSDHGAVPYAPKKETWGTNDEELIKGMESLMHSVYSSEIDKIIPYLNPDSLAKLVDYRYRKTINKIQENMFGLSKEEKEKIGMSMNMDLMIIQEMIKSNQFCMEPIFNPTIIMGEKNYTDVNGVLEQYLVNLEELGVDIPLINAHTDEMLLDEDGRVLTAQQSIKNIFKNTKDNSNGMMM